MLCIDLLIYFPPFDKVKKYFLRFDFFKFLSKMTRRKSLRIVSKAEVDTSTASDEDGNPKVAPVGKENLYRNANKASSSAASSEEDDDVKRLTSKASKLKLNYVDDNSTELIRDDGKVERDTRFSEFCYQIL